MHSGRLAFALAFLASQAVWADLTIRYQFDFKFGPGLPAAAADAAKQQIASMLPGEMATRVKGDKCTSSFGPLHSIIDNGKGEITLFNPATMQFATVPQAGYMDKVLAQQQSLAGAQQALQSVFQNMKIDVQTKKTGATSTIQGIQTEETLVTISMEMPNPAGVSMGLRMEIHQWLATAEELVRLPALSQIAGCSAGLGASADPSAMIEKILGPLGSANGLGDAIKALASNKGKLAMKTQVQVFAPALMAILRAQVGPGATPLADVNAPLAEVSFDLAELSTNPIPDTEFQVPAGYRAAPLEDLMKAIAPAPAQPPKPPVPIAAAPPIEDYNGPTVKPGNGISNPVPVYRPEPRYSEAARLAKIQGGVLLSLVVDQDGATRNIKVIRSLDPGLDQMAIEAVRQWKFRPGQKDGNPVAVMAQIEVSFRLLDKPPGNQ
jgi:TonB family protein